MQAGVPIAPVGGSDAAGTEGVPPGNDTIQAADGRTYTHTGIQADRQAHHPSIQAYTGIHTYRHTDMQAYRHTGILAYWHTGIQACRHTGIQTYRHTGIQTYIHCTQWPIALLEYVGVHARLLFIEFTHVRVV
jgi:hypothetical protein